MSKRNENRPGYKKTRVEWMPEEWIVKTFDHISNVVRGSSPRPAGSPLFFYGTYIPWITVAELTNNEGMFLTSTKSMLTEEGAKRSRIFPKGTLLLVNSGATLGVPKITCIDACGNDGIAGFLDLSSEADISFLYYFLCTKTRYLRDCLAPGLGQPNLNTELIGGISIPLPPLPEQKKIAEILSAWDRAIEQVGKLIDAKQRLKKGLMQQLLTGRMRFLGFGKPVRGKDEQPEGWKACKLGACFKERRETNPDLPLLAITSDRGVIPRDEVERKDTSNADKSKYKRIAPGDIGYNTMRMWQGVSAVSTLEGIVSPAYTICTPKKGHSSSFFGYLFKYPPMIHLFHRFSQGLVSDTLNLKFRHFSQVKANVPLEAEQIRIAAVLSTCDRGIELLRRKEIALRKQKKGLMQKLLTGEVRVKLQEMKNG